MGGAFGSLIGYRCERRHFPSPLVFGGLLYAFTRSRSGVYRTRLPVYPQLSRGNTLQMPPWYCSGSGSRQPQTGNLSVILGYQVLAWKRKPHYSSTNVAQANQSIIRLYHCQVHGPWGHRSIVSPLRLYQRRRSAKWPLGLRRPFGCKLNTRNKSLIITEVALHPRFPAFPVICSDPHPIPMLESPIMR